jgi:hypothetical protein
MAAATVTRYIETADPNTEVVVLTVTNAETYVSRKFGVIHAALATGNEDQDAHINVVYSGATATINYAGMTDKLVTLLLHGE